MDISSFNWGWMDEEGPKTHEVKNFTTGEWRVGTFGDFHKSHMINEIFTQKAYERFCEVKEGDVVLDVGASVGPFTYSILDKNPSKVVCVEPSPKEHSTLENNTKNGPVTIVKKAIGPTDDKIILTDIFDGDQGQNKTPMELDSIRFDTLIKENNIKRINFLKTDCEGGEYDIFTPENIWWVKDNVDFIVGEWHLECSGRSYHQQFREFRDTYLRLFPNHEVYSLDGYNIKWDLWNEHFIEYYHHILIYIDNRK